jgi:uncharacterized protein DUF4112
MSSVFRRMDAGELANKQQALRRLTALATLLDAAFIIPGTNMRMGLAGIIGLVPGIGDLIGGAISSYIVWEARRLGAPRWLIARMMLNVMIETGVGAVPVLGDMFDIVFKANLKNLALLKRYLERRGVRPSGLTIDGTYQRSAVS